MSELTIVAISDLHCGHFAGLTHPHWMVNEDRMPSVYIQQREAWHQYIAWVECYNKPDYLLVLGDCIDGRGDSSGSTEVICTDRMEQCEMASAALKQWEAKNILMVRGTPYHTGMSEDFEDYIARELDATIDDQMYWQPKGLDQTFFMKHKIGSSGVPY